MLGAVCQSFVDIWEIIGSVVMYCRRSKDGPLASALDFAGIGDTSNLNMLADRAIDELEYKEKNGNAAHLRVTRLCASALGSSLSSKLSHWQ